MFISYFDSWYQYGDLNAMNIRLYGEGTWEIYNSLNSDKTGGYFFDSGTFTTLGTTALKLVNDSGIYVADVTLDGDGDLMLSPVISGYGNIYAGAAFYESPILSPTKPRQLTMVKDTETTFLMKIM